MRKLSDKVLKKIKKARRARREKKAKEFNNMCVYFILSKKLNLVKIGCTTNVSRRLEGLKTANPDDLEILLILPGYAEEERKLHEEFSRLRCHREWFRYEEPLVEFVKRAQKVSTENLAGFHKESGKELKAIWSYADTLEQVRAECIRVRELLEWVIESAEDIFSEYPDEGQEKKRFPKMIDAFMDDIHAAQFQLEERKIYEKS